MRAVCSFWSKPYRRYTGHTWREPKHHWLAWALSVSLARRHYRETQLVTDTAGRALLIDGLGLTFDEVSTDLDALDNVEPGWWALGKLVAYSLQDRPFVHLDSDVFLWRQLPTSLTSAPVFAQCPEQHGLGDSFRDMRRIEHVFEQRQARPPVEWLWASSRIANGFRKENCGIVGGTRADFLRHYALSALKMVTDPANAAAWRELTVKSNYNMLVEQFLLAACVDYHAIHPRSVYRGIGIRYLFANWAQAHDRRASALAGYTHVLGPFAKQDHDVTQRLEHRVFELDPCLAQRCCDVAQTPFT